MKRIAKPCLIALGFLFVSLGMIGAFLPALPTVPFMILALWCFSKSSKRFHDWLYHHKLFGESLQKWDKYRVIPTGAKIIATSSMILSFTYITIYKDIPLYILIITALIMLYGAYFILSKPSRKPTN